MRLKDRPWKLLGLVLIGTAAVLIGGADLLDGRIDLRHRAISLAADPARFGLHVLAVIAATPAVGLGWLALIGEWNQDYTPRWRPRFDEPERRRAAKR